MSRYACIGVQADERPLAGIAIQAATPELAQEIGRRISSRIPGIEAVEVYQGMQRVGGADWTGRVAA